MWPLRLVWEWTARPQICIVMLSRKFSLYVYLLGREVVYNYMLSWQPSLFPDRWGKKGGLSSVSVIYRAELLVEHHTIKAFPL